jgi:hypothetical protein
MLPPPVPGIKELYFLVAPYGLVGKHWLIKNWHGTGGNIEKTAEGVKKNIEEWERVQKERLK